MEYVKKRSTSISDDEEEESNVYTVVAVAPTSRSTLNLGDTMTLTVMFDKLID